MKVFLNTVDRIIYIGNKTGKVNYSEVCGANLMQPNIMKLN